MFRTSRATGIPVVFPSKTPDRISTWSGSARAEVIGLVPGLLRSSSGWISETESGSPAGHPSITTPIAGPWLSPNVVMRNDRPKVFIPSRS